MHENNLRDLGGGTGGGLLAARAAAAPDKTALVFHGQEFTYAELDTGSTQAALGLLELGLAPGDRVGVFLSNRPEFVFAANAISRAGLVQVPVNTMYKGAFLRDALARAGCSAVITQTQLAPVLDGAGPLPETVGAVIYVDTLPQNAAEEALGASGSGGVKRLFDWQDVLSAGKASAGALPDIKPSDPAAIMFTSGTTGASKGVVVPHLQGLTMAREAAAAFEVTSRDRLYTCLPLFHGAAQVTSYLAASYAGAAFVLSSGFSASRFWDEIRQTGATQFNAMGSLLSMLLAQPPRPDDRDHGVDRVFAAPAPPELLYRFEERFGLHIIEGYGQTEIKNVLYNPRRGRKVGSLGLPTPSSIVQVHDDSGRRAAAGAVGEIVYRPKGPDIMLKGYLDEAEATLAGMRDLWWHTGDLGYEDADGFLFFVDRKKDALRHRGENISSQQLEATIGAFPGIREAAAVAVPSDLGEDEILVVFEVARAANADADADADADAATEPDTGADTDTEFDYAALFQHCDATLPRFMVPRYYRVAAELPRTPVGKVRKASLREAGLAAGTWDARAAGLTATRHL